ncbi:hypothetical protein SKAU_G00142640 [Synaphobranchus kaupii]|uniref:B box-type domain-containing protein n=1 Tax=Synaphobranchus kaupii TaxID=118154 RepID=A0A9Q1J4E7_SYNKA|nr:hypothetical protein SKAU_G00142640 [Synaphobranchus kaupii]
MEDPPLNRALRSIVESYLKQKTESEIADKSDARCSLHGEKLLLFCEHDKEPLCLVCQTSKKHRNHPVSPVEEAALDLKSQNQHTERQIKAEFEKLHQFLREEEEARLAALREEEKQRSQIMEEKTKNITRHVSILTDKITAIEKVMETEDTSFLKSYKNIKERAQCTLQDPELLSGALIDVAKYLGNLKYRVWRRCWKWCSTWIYEEELGRYGGHGQGASPRGAKPKILLRGRGQLKNSLTASALTACYSTVMSQIILGLVSPSPL